jgi:peptidoglycan/LPS O-acetylase OafA/YrhL
VDRFTSRKIDVLRFFAVASVVVYHAYPLEPGVFIVAPPAPTSASGFAEAFISLALMRWALPFLGVVSGYLFFRTFEPSLAGYLGKLRTRVRTLLVPFLIWSGLGVLFTVAVTVSPFAEVSPYWTVDSAAQALERWLLHPATYPLWFLQALMACMVLSPLVYLAVRLLRGWVLLIAAAWWVLGWQPSILWPWVGATATPAFIAGAAVALLGWSRPPGWASRRAGGLTAAWLAGAAVFTAYGHELGRWSGAGLLPVVVLGICAAWTLPDALRDWVRRSPGRERAARGVLFVAPLSFFVYVTQEPALSVATHAAESLGGDVPQPVVYLTPPVLVVAAAVAAGLILRRAAPGPFAVLTGGRVPRAEGRRGLSPTPEAGISPKPEADSSTKPVPLPEPTPSPEHP